MVEFQADLHCHSTCSDGTLTPTELISHAKEIGLQGLSITDHDTIAAYETAIPMAKQVGLQLITGVEYSANQNGNSIHILGYAFSSTHPAILSLCKRHIQRRHQRNQEILERLAKHGMPLTMEDIFEDEHLPNAIGRPHIAQALMKKGYVGSIQEAFKKYIAEGKPCYVPGSPFSVAETLQVIHDAHGLAVIAHPHLIEQPEIVQLLLEMDFDGIECFYGNFHADQNQRWIKIADKKGWLKTGGSDYHGSIKPAVPLGCAYVGEETFNILNQHYLKNI